jgi:hypothetical protein
MESLVHLCMKKLRKKKVIILSLPQELREPNGYLHWCAHHRMRKSNIVLIFGGKPISNIIKKTVDNGELSISYVHKYSHNRSYAVTRMAGVKCKCRGPHTLISMNGVTCNFCSIGLSYITTKSGCDTREVYYKNNRAIHIHTHGERMFSSAGYNLQNMTQYNGFFTFSELIKTAEICRVHKIAEDVTNAGVKLMQIYLSSKND